MLNNVILVGRLTDNPTTNSNTITLAVTRTYKNIEGAYDTDFIDIRTTENIQKQITEYLNKGDLIGIKGRIETETSNNGIKSTYIVADRVTFLSQPQPTQNIMNKGEI